MNTNPHAHLFTAARGDVRVRQRRWRCLCTLALGVSVWLVSGGALALDGEQTVGDVREDTREDTRENAAATAESSNPQLPRKHIRDHHRQGNINLLFGAGWYFAAPYDKNDPAKACGYDKRGESQAVCSAASALHLDILGGYGLTPGIELLVLYRQGLQSAELGRPLLRLLGAGVRFYVPAASLFKMGVGVVPMVDLSKRLHSDARDFLLHIPISAQWDFVRWFGLYLQVAPNFSFVSEFRFDLTYGLGVQGRFP